MKKIVKSALIGYFSFLIVIYFAQSFFIYHPTTFKKYDESMLSSINGISVSEQNIEWIFLPSQYLSNKTLVYFHGNSGTAIDRSWKASFWRDNGYNVVLAEYPGYGTNEGQPGEKIFYDAGRTIINKTKLDFPNTELYIYGESIGSGTAVQMAAEYDEKALIIEAGFSSLADVAFSKMPVIPVNLLLKDRFDNVAKINEINSKLLLIHGNKDRVVSIKFGQKLFDAFAGKKEMLEIQGADHNNIYAYADMKNIIKSLN